MTTEVAAEREATLWHTQTAQQVCQKLDVEVAQGLSTSESQTRLQQYGANRLPEASSRSALLIFISQFSDLMVLILIAAAVVSGLVGELADTITIIVILVLNAVIGFIQEIRAEQAMNALRKLAAPSAKVRRDAQVKTIDADELVPGDIILLDAGDTVPADARLIESANARTDESTLTGESEPVDKHIEPIAKPHALVGDRVNMVFKGSLLTHGRVVAVVAATGLNTELGSIARLLEKEAQPKTPLQERLAILGKQLAFVVLFVCVVLFAVGLLRGEPALLMFLTAVSLAVAAIPEALPAVVNIALAVGARQMSEKNALIRRLPAVESLGSVTYICTDKTGTLTLNKMHASHVFDANTWQASDKVESLNASLLKAMALCNDAQVSADTLIGDPTETAILAFAQDQHQNKDFSRLLENYPRVAEVPFDSVRKSMTTMHREDAVIVAYSKGSPERILSLCTHDASTRLLSDQGRAELLQQARAMAARGQRVLGFAQRIWDRQPSVKDVDSIESGLQFLGFIALIDPPRPEAKEAVRLCQSAGIVPVMITGDHVLTASAIAQELGISRHEDEVLSGEELFHLNDEQLNQVILEKRVYARVSPEQKIRIVEALQKQQQFVAMTGDGVNDAPALRFAHVGIAMGRKGTDVAREASDVILLDDNFATIVHAVRAGRRIYDNIRKFIRYTMTSNAGEVWTLLLAPLVGMPVPLLPIHILWINLVTDGLPGLALSLEKEEPNLMQRPPRPPRESVFANGMWQHILVIGLLIGLLSLGVQVWAIAQGIEHWQTMVFTVLTFSQLAHVMAIRSETQSLLQFGIGSNKKLLFAVSLTIGLQLLIIYLPFFNDIFKTQALSISELLICCGLSFIVFLAVELEKYLVRKKWIYQIQVETGKSA
ncbi:MAG: calcium-translocating P-type ATPase, PMCA-type [Gammaproteobacteria bacterium]|nr:calcium-translocating P-type ATPase, PMCA-type [Gammaproteobacteria bacterium]